LILKGPEVPRYDGVSVSYPRESEKAFLLIGIKLKRVIAVLYIDIDTGIVLVILDIMQ
jgi:hypothetical protein